MGEGLDTPQKWWRHLWTALNDNANDCWYCDGEESEKKIVNISEILWICEYFQNEELEK